MSGIVVRALNAAFFAAYFITMTVLGLLLLNGFLAMLGITK